MSEIFRNRTIRPSTRLEKSKTYKIDTKSITCKDILVVNIDHESKPFKNKFMFKGSDIIHKDNISFSVIDFGAHIDISWSGVIPFGLKAPKATVPSKKNIILRKYSTNRKICNSRLENSKTSFHPISNSNTTILILGTMPGEKSLELGEYYGHSRNKFWKIISAITDNDLPLSYKDKKALLLKTRIGVWDVAHKVIRKGSLDNAIVAEEPNDLNNFIATRTNLKVIGFNGTKSQAIYDKYFDRKSRIKYILLPSTS